MGTRYFNKVEGKNSRIKWEQADLITKQKLVKAINKYSHGIAQAKVARVLIFVPAVILFVLFIGFLYIINKNVVQSIYTIIFYIFHFKI
ncbi:MAG: hypothetical protein ACK5LC_01565 [Coprobacillaceae bacterium]